jgi:peptidoglycan/xylan/chitin deacetylase (PgdA/CDA1 family)
LAFERNPAVAAAVRDAGYDVCCHGWRWVEPFRLKEAEERDHIARAVASLIETTGQRPLGWYSRFGPSEHTRRLLVEEGGFLYDCDAYNDELPYWTRVGDQAHFGPPRARAGYRPLPRLCARTSEGVVLPSA